MQHIKRLRISSLMLLVILIVTIPIVQTMRAAEDKKTSPKTKQIGPNPQQYQKTVTAAIEYLRTKGQAEDGSFNGKMGPGVTALITSGLIQNGRTEKDPMVAKAVKFILKHTQKNGGIYKKGSNYRNYDTCLSILCLSQLNKDGKYTKTIKNADKFIRELQWDGGEGLDKSDTNFGGAGYGKHKRPDMSNTAYFIEALKTAGAGADDPAMKAALRFVGQSQNLESEHNTGKWATKNPDGGIIYSPNKEGETKSDTLPNGGLRSYGSMTYAGLKSFIYAGLDKDDKRVKAAMTWVEKHYDLKSNPGMGTAGLYYYYQMFAKALDVVGEDTFTDAKGKVHDWRQELANELATRQKKDGSFANKNARWFESDSNLATGYALLALSYCKPKVSQK